MMDAWAKAELAADREHYDAGSLDFLFPFKDLALYGPKPPNSATLDPRRQDEKQDFQKQNIANFNLEDCWLARGYASADPWDGSFLKLSYSASPFSRLAGKAAAAKHAAEFDHPRLDQGWRQCDTRADHGALQPAHGQVRGRNLGVSGPRPARQARREGPRRLRHGRHRRRYHDRARRAVGLPWTGDQWGARSGEPVDRADQQPGSGRYDPTGDRPHHASGASRGCRGRLGERHSAGLGQQ